MVAKMVELGNPEVLTGVTDGRRTKGKQMIP